MSGDEVFVLLASIVAAFFAWGAWYTRLLAVRRLGVHTAAPGRGAIFLAPPVAGALLWVVLRVGAAPSVRESGMYVAMYLLLGAAWVGGAAHLLLPLLGLSARDDVAERGNRAASWAIAGALLALTLCYAGGNVGDGPGWWVVIFSAALATATLAVLWVVVDAVAGVGDSITVDRDEAAGLRLAGLLIALGAIAGRAVAGDWVSAGSTVRDFAALAWPAVVLAALAVMVERAARPTPGRPIPPRLAYGVMPAALYLAAAAWLVWRAGAPA